MDSDVCDDFISPNEQTLQLHCTLKPHLRGELHLVHIWSMSGETAMHSDEMQDTVPL
jgi:hypothetical protein